MGQIEERSPQTVDEYRRKLKDRIADLLGGAERTSREFSRRPLFLPTRFRLPKKPCGSAAIFRSFPDMLDAGGAVGRRLDFLVQEMNREANTIGSKCVDAQIAHWVVDMKAEIENIREQIQNIE